MGSSKWWINGEEVMSAVRHTVIPILAGGALGALQAMQTGTFDLVTIKTAGVTAIVSGVIRFLQKFTSDNVE